MTVIQKRLGLTVRRLRTQAGYSQEEFAQVAGLHRTYMGRVENGRSAVTIVKLEKIAIALKLSPSELLAEVENED
jgi:transcriptional regulator with XRE-family HTH domain